MNPFGEKMTTPWISSCDTSRVVMLTFGVGLCQESRDHPEVALSGSVLGATFLLGNHGIADEAESYSAAVLSLTKITNGAAG